MSAERSSALSSRARDSPTTGNDSGATEAMSKSTGIGRLPASSATLAVNRTSEHQTLAGNRAAWGSKIPRRTARAPSASEAAQQVQRSLRVAASASRSKVRPGLKWRSRVHVPDPVGQMFVAAYTYVDIDSRNEGLGPQTKSWSAPMPTQGDIQGDASKRPGFPRCLKPASSRL